MHGAESLPHLNVERVMEAASGRQSFKREPATRQEAEALTMFFKQYYVLPSPVLSMRDVARRTGTSLPRLYMLRRHVYWKYGRLEGPKSSGCNWDLYNYCFDCRRRFPKHVLRCDNCGKPLRQNKKRKRRRGKGGF
jgi:hypothetical protein